ncbi:LysR substrate-binding domain-containing protein [Marinactinospora rubrisoli]|uniref:LysR substrate-binding domain-containing protein n=1 Tax=Marinactinospora rubrisoli TaxID=2715399 RepID=A0ABW2KCK0_9ACTN
MRVDAAEIECFLAVARELHFARAAERLGLSPSRASQLVAALERRLGVRLFERTTRLVRLTAEGRLLADSVGPAFDTILAALERTRRRGALRPGTLVVGQQGLAAGDLTTAILTEFTSMMPDWRVRVVELNFANQFDVLRDGDVDVALARLPVHEDDIVVGPIVLREPRALAVPVDHRLAGRTEVSIEEIADDFVFDLPRNAPEYWRDFHVPRVTPAGSPLQRREAVSNPLELLTLIGAGRGVSPVVASMSDYYPRPDVRYIPITDMAPSEVAVTWLRDRATPQALAFASAAAVIAG